MSSLGRTAMPALAIALAVALVVVGVASGGPSATDAPIEVHGRDHGATLVTYAPRSSVHGQSHGSPTEACVPTELMGLMMMLATRVPRSEWGDWISHYVASHPTQPSAK